MKNKDVCTLVVLAIVLRKEVLSALCFITNRDFYSIKVKEFTMFLTSHIFTFSILSIYFATHNRCGSNAARSLQCVISILLLTLKATTGLSSGFLFVMNPFISQCAWLLFLRVSPGNIYEPACY